MLLFQLDEINLDEDEDEEALDTDNVESKEQDKTKLDRKTSEDADQGSKEEIPVHDDGYDPDRDFQIPKTEISHDGDANEVGLSEMDQVIPRKLHPLLALAFDLSQLFIIIPPRGLLFLIMLMLK